MRNTVLLALLLSIFTTGCRHYLITLSNGNRITSRGKPKLERGYFRYRDINGTSQYVPDTRVRSIEPQRRGFTEEAEPPKR